MKEATHHMTKYRYSLGTLSRHVELCLCEVPTLRTILNPEEEVTCLKCQEMMTKKLVEEL